MKLKKVIATIMMTTIIGTGVFALTGCGNKSTSKDLIVATSAEFAPFEFHKTVNGKDEIIGADIEIAKEIAKAAGKNLVVKDMEFDAVITAVKDGKADIGIAGISRTEKREKVVGFSDIYYVPSQNVLVRAEDKDKYKTVADFQGKKVGAQMGSIQADVAKAQIAGAEIQLLGRVPDLIMALESGKIDGLVLESPVAKLYELKDTKVAVSATPLTSEDEGYAIVVKKGNDDLLTVVNKTLKSLISADKINQFISDATNLVENK